MFHITAAFCFVSGSVAAGILNVLAIRAERPSDTAYLLRLVRLTLPVIFVGTGGTLVFGLWLWHELHFSAGSAVGTRSARACSRSGSPARATRTRTSCARCSPTAAATRSRGSPARRRC
jgi:hypothetical protein